MVELPTLHLPNPKTLTCLILVSLFALEIIIVHLAVEPLRSATETTPVLSIGESPEVCDAPVRPSPRRGEATCRPAPSDGYYFRNDGTKFWVVNVSVSAHLVDKLGGNHTIERWVKLANSIRMLEFSEEVLPIETAVALILALAYLVWALYLSWRPSHVLPLSDTSVTSNTVPTFSQENALPESPCYGITMASVFPETQRTEQCTSHTAPEYRFGTV